MQMVTIYIASIIISFAFLSCYWMRYLQKANNGIVVLKPNGLLLILICQNTSMYHYSTSLCLVLKLPFRHYVHMINFEQSWVHILSDNFLSSHLCTFIIHHALRFFSNVEYLVSSVLSAFFIKMMMVKIISFSFGILFLFTCKKRISVNI